MDVLNLGMMTVGRKHEVSGGAFPFLRGLGRRGRKGRVAFAKSGCSGVNTGEYKRPSHSVSVVSPICQRQHQHLSTLGANTVMRSHSGFRNAVNGLKFTQAPQQLEIRRRSVRPVPTIRLIYRKWYQVPVVTSPKPNGE